MKLTWSDKAEDDFAHNIEFLYKEWNEAVVKDFTLETERVLKIIQNTPSTFRLHEGTNVRMAIITKRLVL